jgi:hypothetical protein
MKALALAVARFLGLAPGARRVDYLSQRNRGTIC